MTLPVPPLLVISDRSQARRPTIEIAAAVFAGGGRWFSLREKDLPPAERRALLAELVALGRVCDATVGIHDDIVAAAAAAAGAVHLHGGADPAAARQCLPLALIGVSAHGAAEAAVQLAAGADYVTLSPVFLSDSKPGYGPALGLDGLAAAVRRAGGPVVALAGITAANAAACCDAGAAGIAVMGDVMRAVDPEAVVRDLVHAIVAMKS
ncbi:MAG: thiamine phosphate synthase [Stellaceae bacterium]